MKWDGTVVRQGLTSLHFTSPAAGALKELCDGIQAHKFKVDNNNVQSPRTLSEARKVAGSATCKQIEQDETFFFSSFFNAWTN